MGRRLSREDFVKQLKNEHPELELIGDYNGNKNYITVRCVKHNYTFNTKPNWLHRGSGCQKCYDERRGVSLKKSNETFLSELEEIYKDKNYDFSKVKYVNANTKVTIICKKHGEFHITPNHIITRGDSCPKCSREENGLKKRLTLTEFIKRAKEVHGDKYDYSKVQYTTIDTPVLIICKKHGEFMQTPYSHLSGCGCKKCNESKLEKTIRALLIKENIHFTEQQRFDWMGLKSLDFFIPSKNIAIECQGLQHFEERKYFGGTCGFEHRKELDIKKYNECLEHNIRIIYVINNNIEINNEDFKNIYINNLFTLDKFSKFDNWLNG